MTRSCTSSWNGAKYNILYTFSLWSCLEDVKCWMANQISSVKWQMLLLLVLKIGLHHVQSILAGFSTPVWYPGDIFDRQIHSVISCSFFHNRAQISSYQITKYKTSLFPLDIWRLSYMLLLARSPDSPSCSSPAAGSKSSSDSPYWCQEEGPHLPSTDLLLHHTGEV